MKNKYLHLTFFMLFHLICFSQNQKKIDDLIKKTALLMYENPEKVIKVGDSILKNLDLSTESRIKAYKLISDGYSSKRNYQKSLEYVIKASNLLPQSDDKLLQIQIINKIGIQYHQLKIYDKAIQYLDEAEKLCLQYPDKNSVKVSLGINYMVRGFIYKDKLSCDIAIAFFNKGIDEIKQSQDLKSNFNKLSIAKYNKGNCYMLMSDYEQAIISFNEAIHDAQKVKASSLVAFAKKGLAQVYTSKGNYHQAISLLKDALIVSKDVNDLVLNQEVYKGLSENYLALNNLKEYQYYEQKYRDTQTSLRQNERQSINSLLSEKQSEINKNSNEMTIYFIIVFIIVGLFIVLVLVYFYCRKIKEEILNIKEEIQVKTT